MHIEAGTVLKIGDQTITVGTIRRIGESHGCIMVTIDSSTGEPWMLSFGEATVSGVRGVCTERLGMNAMQPAEIISYRAVESAV